MLESWNRQTITLTKARRIANQFYIDQKNCNELDCYYQYCSSIKSDSDCFTTQVPCHLWKITKMHKFLI